MVKGIGVPSMQKAVSILKEYFIKYEYNFEINNNKTN
jgi:hypothetical protein